MKKDARLEEFERERSQLRAMCYRMLGSLAEADDVLQEAWLRWQDVDWAEIEQPAAYLRRIVSRLCIDQLRRVKRLRETYVGPWLPEPVPEGSLHFSGDGPLAQDITIAFLLALERLSPAERAVLLLHDVFGTPFTEIADIIEKSESACRQIAVRARHRVRSSRIAGRADRSEAQRLANAFIHAVREGDVAALERVLSEDVKVHTDGGGVRSAALNVIDGRQKAIRLFLGLRRRFSGIYPQVIRTGWFNGSPGFVSRDVEGNVQVTVLEPSASSASIASVYVVRNPSKLTAIRAAPG